MEEQKSCNCYAGCCDLLCVLEQAIIAIIQAKESNEGQTDKEIDNGS